MPPRRYKQTTGPCYHWQVINILRTDDPKEFFINIAATATNISGVMLLRSTSRKPSTAAGLHILLHILLRSQTSGAPSWWKNAKLLAETFTSLESFNTSIIPVNLKFTNSSFIEREQNYRKKKELRGYLINMAHLKVFEKRNKKKKDYLLYKIKHLKQPGTWRAAQT